MRKESLKIDGIVDDANETNGDNGVASEIATNGNGKLKNAASDDNNESIVDSEDPFEALLRENPAKKAAPVAAEQTESQTDIKSESKTSADADNLDNGAAADAAGTSSVPGETNGDGGNDDGDGGYEVEDIIDHKYTGKRMKKFYLIRWKGYGSTDDTWEPEVSLTCPDIVSAYLEKHPDERPPEKLPKVKAPKRQKKTVEAVARVMPKRAAAHLSSYDNENANDNEDYEVAAIVSHKVQDGQNYYLVKWKNYGSKDNTWEPEASLSCADLLAAFHKQPKSKTKSPKKTKIVKGGKDVAKKSAKAVKNDTGYEVEKIINSRIEKGKKVFLIRWKGYSAKDDTWEPLSSLNCPEKIKEFENAKKPSNKGKQVKEAEATNDEETGYEVEQIVGEKTERGKKCYLVKWKGFSSKENTWEPEKLLSCPDLVSKFKASQKASTPNSSSNNKKRKSALKSPTATPAKRGRKSVSYADDVQDSIDAIKKLPSRRATKAVAVEKDPLACSDNEDDTENGGNNEKEWEVEKIIAERDHRGIKQYLIRWKGCKPEADTWEPESQLNCSELIAAFGKKVPARRGRPAKKSLG